MTLLAPAAQLPLFCGPRRRRLAVPPRELARRSDPIGSHEAAARVVSTGQAATEAEQVLQALRRHCGTTSRELAKRSGLDRYLVGRRLVELEDAGLVRCAVHRPDERRPLRAVDDAMEPCSVSGIRASRWWPVP